MRKIRVFIGNKENGSFFNLCMYLTKMVLHAISFCWRAIQSCLTNHGLSNDQETCVLNFFNLGVCYQIQTLPQWLFKQEQSDLKSTSSSVSNQNPESKSQTETRKTSKVKKMKKSKRKESIPSPPPPTMLQIITKCHTLLKPKKILVQVKGRPDADQIKKNVQSKAVINSTRCIPVFNSKTSTTSSSTCTKLGSIYHWKLWWRVVAIKFEVEFLPILEKWCRHCQETSMHVPPHKRGKFKKNKDSWKITSVRVV